jgi:2-C-methyl-D-erythritol 4-phosphate cytidylyltransferase
VGAAFSPVPTATAIIVAAGPGSRLGAGVPKAFVALAGVPLVIRSLRAMLAAPSVGAAVVVVPPGSEERTAALLKAHGPWRHPITIVAGGAERQDSVRHGLAAAPNAELVAIHDAARPFVHAESVEAAIDSAVRHGAATVAVPATDTVKQVSDDGRVEHTPPRTRMWLAQTPQVFRAAVIRRAHAEAAGGAATDDAMLVERLGLPVYVVAANPENRKITTADDLRWAEWLLAQTVAPR